MWKKYLVLLLVPLILILPGCGKRRHYVAPPPSPFAPFDLVATAASSTQIDLTWKETSENEKGFYVYRRLANSFQKIAVLDPDTTSYSDSALTPETTYWYKVTAYTDDGESGPSNVARATTPAEIEILDYHMHKHYNSYSEEWDTYITGNVKNNTSRTVTIWIKGKFISYKGTVIATEDTYVNNLSSGRSSEFYIHHCGETEIERVEVWVESYY